MFSEHLSHGKVGKRKIGSLQAFVVGSKQTLQKQANGAYCKS